MPFFVRPARAAAGALLVASACSVYPVPQLSPAGATDSGNGTDGSGDAPTNDESICESASCDNAAPDASALIDDSSVSAAEAEAGTSDANGDADSTPPAPEPYITGTIDPPLIGVGLSVEGRLDWGHWGLQSATDFNHKKVGIAPTWSLKMTGVKQPTRYANDPTTFSWDDGTPTLAATTSNGIMVSGLNEGFSLTVPAFPETHKLHLYVGCFAGTGHVATKLSDPRGSAKGLDDRVTSATEAWVESVVTVEYGNAALGTTLTVSWSVEQAILPSAAVNIKAATLE